MEAALTAVFGTPGDSSIRYDGKTDRQIVREAMRHAGFSDADIDGRLDDVISLYVAGLPERLGDPSRGVGLYPGVKQLIDVVGRHADCVLGLLTGNVEPGARLKLESVGLDFDLFRVNAFGSDSEVRGDLPAVAHRRMEETFGVRLRGTDVIVIGDTPADIACGRELGARALAVATGSYSVEELQAHDPYAVFQDLSDTDAVLAAITG